MRTANSVKEWKRQWLQIIGTYLQLNYPKVGEVQVVDHKTLEINQNLFKVDLNDYTGEQEYYIFLNLVNGRMYLKIQEKVKVFRFEVELIEEE